MKKLFHSLLAITAITVFLTSCDDDNKWDEYEDWRRDNTAWYNTMLTKTDSTGALYYQRLTPGWYSQSGVLIHYFNDRTLTAGNLQPYVTSTVTVKYHGRLYNDIGFDSTTVGSDSVRTLPLSSTIAGWKIALTQMHVGDSCEIIIPYAQGYGFEGSTNAAGLYTIPPYSALKFNIGLKAVPTYEIP